MPKWLIPVNIVEHKRIALVEADTKTAAIEKMRAWEWDELSDPDRYTVTKAGAARLARAK